MQAIAEGSYQQWVKLGSCGHQTADRTESRLTSIHWVLLPAPRPRAASLSLSASASCYKAEGPTPGKSAGYACDSSAPPPLQQDMEAPIAIASPGGSQLLDPLLEIGLIGTAGLVTNARPARRERDLPPYWPANSQPVHGPDQVLKLSFDDSLLHLLVQAEVRYQTLHLRRHQSVIFASPSIIGLDRYAGLATDLLNRRFVLCLLQYERYLLFAEPTLLHTQISWLTNVKTNRDCSHKKWNNFKGSGQSKSANQARRLLALAEIYDGGEYRRCWLADCA